MDAVRVVYSYMAGCSANAAQPLLHNQLVVVLDPASPSITKTRTKDEDDDEHEEASALRTVPCALTPHIPLYPREQRDKTNKDGPLGCEQTRACSTGGYP